ncbi:MAG: hypothetical protein KTR20_02395 [Cellvibrionaceae bacterium]|nr:hypothetical protein [Cellvibrionaceae bacterium]
MIVTLMIPYAFISLALFFILLLHFFYRKKVAACRQSVKAFIQAQYDLVIDDEVFDRALKKSVEPYIDEFVYLTKKATSDNSAHKKINALKVKCEDAFFSCLGESDPQRLNAVDAHARSELAQKLLTDFSPVVKGLSNV